MGRNQVKTTFILQHKFGKKNDIYFVQEIKLFCCGHKFGRVYNFCFIPQFSHVNPTMDMGGISILQIYNGKQDISIELNHVQWGLSNRYKLAIVCNTVYGAVMTY